jgi:glycosyltransferase involved in cell wall biosynthesis
MAQMPVQSKNPLVILGNAARLVDLIRTEKVSIVHARSRAPAFSALWAAQSTRTPFVATYHGVYAAKTPLKRWYNAVMTRGDLVIANSDFTREHVLAEHQIDPARIVTIPRGVDLSRFNPQWVTADRLQALRAAWDLPDQDRRTKIVLAGRLTRIKGHLLIIEAAARLKAQGREDFLILFVGDARDNVDYQAELEQAIAAAGLGDQVRLVGHCSDMPAAFLIGDAAILPTTKPESFGRTAVEPQVMGKPVLASNHGGVVETIVNGETGWLVEPGDPAAWATALLRVLDAGRNRLTAMGQAAADRASRNYSVDAMCQATLAAYARVLEARA